MTDVPLVGRVPVVMVCGIDTSVTSVTAAALAWDAPAAVTVRHDIDVEREVLTRTVADVHGVVERVDIDVEHACVSCAIREDIVPTLERLAAEGRWGTIVAQLPPTAPASQVCRMIDWEPTAAPHVRVAAVVAAFEGASTPDQLLGSDLLVELDLPVRPDDRRGIGETASELVEFADVVVVAGEPDSDGVGLATVMARPGAQVVSDVADLDTSVLVAGVHTCAINDAWAAEVRREVLPQRSKGRAWMLDVHSDRPLHPGRLRDTITELGGGPRRMRGCFWLPTRPHQVCVWDGAGGSVSIGTSQFWGVGEPPLTRIVVIGLDDGRDELAAAFEACLLTDAEMAEIGPYWEAYEDGYEPWLGPIRRAA